jgi:hypothetical protein
MSVEFDHAVPLVVIQDGQPFAVCGECGYPIRRDARPDVEWSHMDDATSLPLYAALATLTPSTPEADHTIGWEPQSDKEWCWWCSCGESGWSLLSKGSAQREAQRHVERASLNQTKEKP